MRPLKTIAIAVMLAVIGVGLLLFWRHEERYPSTQDAYIGANIIYVAAQVTGQVAEVQISDNQSVKNGDLLFTIDDTQFKASVDAAKADLDSAIQQAKSYSTQITAAEASVQSAQSAYDTANKSLERAKALFAAGDVAQASLDQTTSEFAQASARLTTSQSSLLALQSGLEAKQDDILSSQAQLEIAETNLAWTKVYAVADGWIANLTLRPGSSVSANAPQFSIVESSDWWVDANFKETSLPRIRPGQPVTVQVDMLPGVKLTGKVASIGRGSGDTFSLLPSENASGNWVKVTRRFPVRIALDPTDAPLRVGGSSKVVVDTTGPADGK
ncbi:MULTISPECIES: HlyD family secretion protein [unclassified Ruegeria]|uniref:HlyD family secretion protein n=1 Tax=unclassified Ruegeria TaxID=2625375 RepID=UPI001487A786|nr:MULTISPECIES: HlyD family secretion protein [unclassified Ruegeria]NOD34455.1 HlyD family efflux transporter periplasmic adaptor subunit [Ruegeria sp. HKCCD7296]NOE40321.1 HlyD family efflux transporter periplasmic adaptor subunit [Ruegeria sp. HKCCD7319]